MPRWRINHDIQVYEGTCGGHSRRHKRYIASIELPLPQLIGQRTNIGHKALVDCGLLHRDISANKILLATGEEYNGFIHDLDYSTYVPKFAGEDSDPDCQIGLLPFETPKEMTVRRYIAVNVLMKY